MKRIRISKENIHNWPKFERLLTEGKVKWDKERRLRYIHGAPVGDMILTKKNGVNHYQESTDEWFDPESQAAKDFVNDFSNIKST